MGGATELGAGQIVGGDFRVERLLSAGGMGAVYVAAQVSTGKRRALKVMRPEIVSDARSRARFVDEAKVAAQINSAHVIEVIAAGVDEPSGMPWIAMELLDGVDLEAHVAAKGALDFEETLDLLEQAGHALSEAHERGIIHRDLKPENLFLAKAHRRGAADMLKVLDFGIAAYVSSDKTAATVTSAIGSPLWIAPEQAQTGAKLRPATDVWALGLIAFYLLTAKSYWPAANAEAFNLNALLAEILALPLAKASERARVFGAPPLPTGFDAWFARCVAREPTDRFVDATAAVDALSGLSAPSRDEELAAPATRDVPASAVQAIGVMRSEGGVAATMELPADRLPLAPWPESRPLARWDEADADEDEDEDDEAAGEDRPWDRASSDEWSDEPAEAPDALGRMARGFQPLWLAAALALAAAVAVLVRWLSST